MTRPTLADVPRPMRAGGADDPALAETSWPLPPPIEADLAWRLRFGRLSHADRLFLAEILGAYRTLICGGTTTQQTRRLAALRRVWRRRNR